MRVLLVVHGFPPRARGGTELYAEAHASSLASRHHDDVLVLAREDDPARGELTVREERRDGYRIAWINHTFRTSASIEDAWRAPRVMEALEPVLDGFAPDAAHVHHLTCLSTLLPARLAARGVPVTATLHDYWLMCHRGQLLGVDGARCDGPGTTGCPKCFDPAVAMTAGPLGSAGMRAVREVARAVPSVASMLRRAVRPASGASGSQASARVSLARCQHVAADVVPHVALFFAPCAHMRDRFVAFGIPEARIRVSPYGLARVDRTPHRTPSAGPLRVGFVGSLMRSKAPHIAMHAVAMLPSGTATLDVCGAVLPYHGDHSYATVVDRCARHDAIRLHGALDPTAVDALLASLDVLVVPSIWEENSPFVILEAFRAGITVVASRIGGIPELVDDGVNGLLVEPGDAAALADTLGRLAADRGLLARLQARGPTLRSLDDAVGEMRAEHVRLMSATARVGAHITHTPRRSTIAVVLHYGNTSETALAVRALRAVPQLDRIVVVDNDPSPALIDVGGVGVPVEVIANGRNLGFSGGMNTGVRRALALGADAVLLVNSDAIVPPDTVERLSRALDAHPRAGVVGPLLLARDHPDRVASRGIRFDRTTGRVRNLDVGSLHRPEEPQRWCPVDAVNGAVLLVTRETWERVGLLDEAYFFSFEEIDFCARAADGGFEVAVVGETVAYHRGGASLEPRSTARFYYGARNQLRLAGRSGEASTLSRILRSLAVVGLNVAHALTAPGGHRLARLAAVARGTRDYAGGRFGPEGGSS